jgi:hypothetical protein
VHIEPDLPEPQFDDPDDPDNPDSDDSDNPNPDGYYTETSNDTGTLSNYPDTEDPDTNTDDSIIVEEEEIKSL